MHLVPDTHDLDITNCMFTIVVQLVDMLGIETTGIPALDKALEFNAWRACCTDRAGAIKHISDKIGSTAAKKMNLAVANGGKIPAEWAEDKYLLDLSAEGKALRWLACSLLPDVYRQNVSDPDCHWPEARTFTTFGRVQKMQSLMPCASM